MFRHFFINLILISLSISSNDLLPNYFLNQKYNSSSDINIQTGGFNHLIGIMVDFQIEREEFEDTPPYNEYWDPGEEFTDQNNNGAIDYYDYDNNGKYDQRLINGKLYYEDYDNPKTSGLGNFVLDNNSLNYNFESYSERCDAFIVDNAPHNADYFQDQLLSIKNYYKSISNELIDFDTHIIDRIYTVEQNMGYYSDSDDRLGQLFSESLELAKSDIEDYLSMNDIDVNDVFFVVFHAGLGQDFSVPFLDPTTQDLKSAYIDSDMLNIFDLPIVNNVSINRGILLPETQNFIFYDVVEDIFPELKTDDSQYCGIQVGLTGTFAFLLGYEFDLDVMFLPDGMTGVGKFGLMDYGSNNGRGVIPSPPNPWNRIKIADQYSSLDNLVYNITESGTYTLKPRYIEDKIYKIKISDSEYYLIENRSNNVIEDFDLEFLQYLYGDNFLCTYCSLGCSGIDAYEIANNITAINQCFEDNPISDKYNYFDLLQNFSTVSSSSVIINHDNYDYGLPGSGLLIWHIDEKRILENVANNIDCGTINCKPDRRGVQLEEADGAIDIGYESLHPLFKDHINGWEYDFWYPGNQYYFNYGNPDIPDNDSLFFNASSIPNTNSNGGYLSLISIQVVDENEGEISFNIDFNEFYDNIILSDSNIEIIGSGNIDGQGNLFYVKNDSIYQHNDSEIIFLDDLILFGQNTFNDQKILVFNNEYYFVDSGNDEELVYWDSNLQQLETNVDPFIIGYFESSEELSIITRNELDIRNTSLGDIDSDGFDELVRSNWDGSISIENSNQTYVNGFPMSGDFYGTPIVT